MPWPLSQDYNEAIQSPTSSFDDPELRAGQPVTNALGLPMPRSGNFADVYEFIGASGARWAIKCFTRAVPGLRQRYTEISKHLIQARLPFMVDFEFLERGIRIRGDWYPVLKMQWVEGFLLNEFVRKNLEKPTQLDALLQIWQRMATCLRDANMAHADLQHGNVLLVPGRKAGSLAVKLIDYDGMWVPALAGIASGEVGHPAYQHPQRLREATYNAEVDRFPVLVIQVAICALMVSGRALWDRFDNGDNLLFRQQDLETPSKSALFADLLKLDDPLTRSHVESLIDAVRKPLDQTPLLDDSTSSGQTAPVSSETRWASATLAEPSVITAAIAAPVAHVASPVAVAVVPGATSAMPVAQPNPKRSTSTRNLLMGAAIVAAAVLMVLTLLLVVGFVFYPLLTEKLSAKPDEQIGQKGPLAKETTKAAKKEAPETVVAKKKEEPKKEQEPKGKGTETVPPNKEELTKEELKKKEPLPTTFKNGLGMEFVLVPKGRSWLGGRGGNPGDKEVEIPQDFYLGKFEVSQEEWQRVMGNNPSFFSRNGDLKTMAKGFTNAELKRFPVENVSWDDTQLFLARLNEQDANAAWVYRLPSETQWEYACRGGPMADKMESAFDFYFDKPTNQLLGEQANFKHAKGLKMPRKVGSYKPNKLGLYDMHGNLHEWCEDTTTAPNGALWRVYRGGCWGNAAMECGAGAQGSGPPESHGRHVGFRLARVSIAKEIVKSPPKEKKAPAAVDGTSSRTFKNSLGMELVFVPKGEFMMGSPDSEPKRYPAENQHKVVITRPFHLSAHPVTQAQYQTVVGNNPSWFAASGGGKDVVGDLGTADFPVDSVSSDDAIAFCQKLSAMPEEKKAGRTYRLPTEAEWEYACRAGTKTAYYCGQSISTDQANFNIVLMRTTKVGSYPPNAFGLYDMHGNLLQWCSDWFEHTYYRNSPGADPQGTGSGKLRVDRGGSWNGDARACRAASRSGHIPEHRLNYVGFRIACTERTPS